MSIVGVVFMVLLPVASADASSTVLDSFPLFNLGIQGIQGQLLTTIESVKPFSGISQVAPDFINCTNLLTTVNDSAWLISGLYGYQLNDFAGVYTEVFLAAHFAAVIVLAVGLYWLKIDRHFSRDKCTAFSFMFWVADMLVCATLCRMVGLGLGLFAFRKRGSWLLFPRCKCLPTTSPLLD
jgi:hypothetical protein